MNEPDAALRYHGATSHLARSARPDDQAGLLLMGYRPDPGTAPVGSKRYADDQFRPPVALPVDVTAVPPAGPLSAAALARVLYLSLGVVRRRPAGPGPERLYRAAPSAGGMAPIEAYVALGEGSVPGLGAGLFHYDPAGHALVEVRAGDARRDLLAATGLGDPGDRVPAAVLVLTGVPWKACWFMRERGYRHLWWDAGTAWAHMAAVAAESAVETGLYLSFADAEAEAVLGVDGRREQVLALATLGSPAAGDGPAGEPGAAYLPGTRADLGWGSPPVEFPLVNEVHWAGRLAGTGRPPEAVAAWARTLVDTASPASGGSVPAPAPPVPGGLAAADVVLRRRSARLLSAGPVPARPLLDCLRFATHGVAYEGAGPGRLTEHAVVVHDVEGVSPGAYQWTGGLLTPTRQADLRMEAAVTCLRQHQAFDAAFVHLALVDLPTVVGALGSRGYRAASFEAGVVSGRIQLAAAAAGLTGTGLTFFDDLAPALTGRGDRSVLLATAVGRPGTTAVPGGLPRRPATVGSGPGWERVRERAVAMSDQIERATAG